MSNYWCARRRRRSRGGSDRRRKYACAPVAFAARGFSYPAGRCLRRTNSSDRAMEGRGGEGARAARDRGEGTGRRWPRLTRNLLAGWRNQHPWPTWCAHDLYATATYVALSIETQLANRVSDPPLSIPFPHHACVQLWDRQSWCY